MFNLGPMEVLVIVVIALVVLGPQRLPDAMRQVGKGVSEARRWSSQLTGEVQSAFAPGPDPAPSKVTVAPAIASHADVPSPTPPVGAGTMEATA